MNLKALPLMCAGVRHGVLHVGEIDEAARMFTFACPVCGVVQTSDCLPASVESNAEGFYYGFSFDICLCCGTEYGCDENLSGPGPDELTQAWAELRARWLRKVTVDAGVCAQLRNIEVYLE